MVNKDEYIKLHTVLYLILYVAVLEVPLNLLLSVS